MVGERFQHYKGEIVTVIWTGEADSTIAEGAIVDWSPAPSATATDSITRGEPVVFYYEENSQRLWVRPLNLFLGKIDDSTDRFSLVERVPRWGCLAGIAIVLAAIVIPQIAIARQILLVRPKMPTVAVCENDAAFVPRGGRYILDKNQGYVLALTPASIDIPICRNEMGGYQTLFRIRVGKIRSKFRKLTHPASFIKTASLDWQASLGEKETLVSTTGTEFTTEAIGSGLRVGMNEGSILARSGGVDARAIVGQAVTLEPGKAPEVYPINYSLDVYNIKVSTYLNQNLVTGCLAKGNSLSVEDGEVTTNGDCFRVVTPQNFLKITNPAGTERYLFFGAKRRLFNE